ncbi:MAG TPA: patatin-like phospholipase family protein [Candidatus Acidoferrales bacterium]|nr:patatin-like phospholipase family protein [Candidatus Acidoferrales bacterium]
MPSDFQPEKDRLGIALCLSGGGYRASLFHGGALRRLNEVGLLSQVRTITSVSGGSITNALLAKHWPNFSGGRTFANFAEFENDLRGFCARDIRTGSLTWERLDPRNWATLMSDDHSATDLLAQQYEDHLVPKMTLGDTAIAKGPKFIFCATNLQTGASFEQSCDRIGDYQIGYAKVPEMRLSDAVAASSAFPIAFPPLIVKFDPDRFSGGKLSDAALRRQLARRIALTDGGVYDNLGLEPVWKTHRVVLCSDGGKPFSIAADPGAMIANRLMRSQEVIGNQALALRKRWLVSSFETKVYGGAYWGIGTEIEGYPKHDAGYAGEMLEALRAVRTDLNVFKDSEQLVLMNHGWALADAAIKSYCTDLLQGAPPDGTPPDSALLKDSTAALDALRNPK